MRPKFHYVDPPLGLLEVVWKPLKKVPLCPLLTVHRLDSIQGTDYAATPILGFLAKKLKI